MEGTGRVGGHRRVPRVTLTGRGLDRGFRRVLVPEPHGKTERNSTKGEKVLHVEILSPE